MATRSANPTDRFIAEVGAGSMKPAYLLIGDEVFFRDRCRKALLQHLVPPELREFSFYEVDLRETGVIEVLDRAQTRSLMAPFQVFFIRGVKNLYSRGSHADEFAAIEKYVADPNPDAVLVFVADHISITADVRKMEMADKDAYEKMRESLGQSCSVIELARVEDSECVAWAIQTAAESGITFDRDAARELVDASGTDMMLVSNELEKLALYVGEKKRITIGDVETLVLAAKQRSLYELTDAISSKDQVRALQVLQAILSATDGEEGAIGHLYMLAKTFRQMLVIVEKNVRDSRTIWQALWQGFRVPPFAAEDIIRQARRYKSRREITSALRTIAKADAALRSNPVSKRILLEKLVFDLAAHTPARAPVWEQEELLV